MNEHRTHSLTDTDRLIKEDGSFAATLWGIHQKVKLKSRNQVKRGSKYPIFCIAISEIFEWRLVADGIQ